MITDYQTRKNEVLDVYKKMEHLIEEVETNCSKADLIDQLVTVQPLIDNIRNCAEKIREDRFSIMVAGESKSGKSTFINSFLGLEILPMDIKQCTSSIIEIKNGDEFLIKATYANGQIKHYGKNGNQQEAHKFLKENAAINDKYRDIPVPTINNEILIKAGQKALTGGTRIKISEQALSKFLEEDVIKEANIHNLNPEDYKRKIETYINNTIDSWQNIITKIEVIYNFPKSMKGLEIIDSPGVAALGGVGEVTSSYIDNANAIIFLKPLVGQALESTQFNRFLKNHSVDKNKDAVFLVFTHTANLNDSDLQRLKSEVKKQFNMINESNILYVDSKAELYANKFKNLSLDMHETLIIELNQKGTLDNFAELAYLRTKDKNNFVEELQKASGFKKVYSAMDEFGRKAHYILLSELLQSIDGLYAKLCEAQKSNLEFFKKKAKDPIELATQIDKLTEELNSVTNKMAVGVHQITDKFRDSETGLIRKYATEKLNKYKTEISNIDPNSRSAFEELEKTSLKEIDEYKNLLEEIQKETLNEFNKKLIELSKSTTTDIPIISLSPNFDQTTFKKLIGDTREKAQEARNIEEGVTFKETRREYYYSHNKHFDIVKNSITQRLNEIKNTLVKEAENFVERLRAAYTQELNSNKKDIENNLIHIRELKITAEKIQQNIEILLEIIKKLNQAESEVAKLKGGIAKYVS